MHSEISILIRAPAEKIFAITSDLQNWPKLLPHYRYVRVLERKDNIARVIMAARRGWLPIRWEAVQEIDVGARTVYFRHESFWTRGMRVVWTYTPQTDGTLVKIAHDMPPRWPLVGRWFAERVIGEFFIAPIASQTLEHFKRHLENES